MASMFSQLEIKHILISLAVLIIVFSYPEFISRPVFLLTAILTVGIAFFGHELSHKFSAIRLGYWSEYRMWGYGLLLALIFAIATGGGLIFAAPGAVYFSKRFIFQNPTKADIGKIGLSGPLFNIILTIILIGIWIVFPFSIIAYMIKINSWLAIFNLIPFGPLDGRKVMSWSPKIWVAALIIPIIGFLLV